MLRQMSMLALGLLLAAALAGCKPVTAPAGGTGAEPAATAEATAEATTESTAEATEAVQGGVGLANPASVFCADNGGKLEIRDETGGQVGYCTFDDGSECEEWAYLRGECAPGETKSGDAQPSGLIGMPNPASVFCTDNGGQLQMLQDQSGGEYGMCIFNDGSECEEWAYLRGECAPGGPRIDANMRNPASVNCLAQGGTLRMEKDAGGGEYSMCVFADGHECEEWALLRGTCEVNE